MKKFNARDYKQGHHFKKSMNAIDQLKTLGSSNRLDHTRCDFVHLYDRLLKKNAPEGKISKRRNPFYILQFKYQNKDIRNNGLSFLGSTGVTEAKKHSYQVKKDMNGVQKLMMLEGGCMEDDIRKSVR